MKYWLTNKDMSELGVDDGKWHRVEIEYHPPIAIIKVDNEYVAAEVVKEEV